MEEPIVTLSSDFGLADAYVAALKAAILRQAPTARLIDVTHHVSPGDVLGGSIVLERAVAAFGPGCVHLSVVDPGVGTSRRILVVQIHRQMVVCPDNGLITWAWRRLGRGKAHELTWRPRRISRTFHGRDIMAPAAGMLAAGRPISQIARPIDTPLLLNVHLARCNARRGRIIHIDHFGNAMTNIPRQAMAGKRTVRVGKRRLRIAGTYAQVPSGTPLALIASADLLEIAVRDGSAAAVLALHVGDEVMLE
ncbi:MAG: SAM-dependent chlorinase/fluorinase [Tepidisphaeraceae bacterium]|jgi:hypothetical protein